MADFKAEYRLRKDRKERVSEEEINKFLKKIFNLINGSTLYDLTTYLKEVESTNYEELNDREKDLITILKSVTSIFDSDRIFLKDDKVDSAWAWLDRAMYFIYLEDKDEFWDYKSIEDAAKKLEVVNEDDPFVDWYYNVLGDNLVYFLNFFMEYDIIKLVEQKGPISSGDGYDDYKFSNKFCMIIDLDKKTLLSTIRQKWSNGTTVRDDAKQKIVA